LKLLRFYRGISVSRYEAEGVIAKIRSQGLQPGDGRWTMMVADLKPQLDKIWRKPTITLTDTRPEAPKPTWVCACADEDSALYYACSHNKSAEKDTPILIGFNTEPSKAIVDGRDFLYTAFQLGDPKRARPVIERIFGSAILRYIDRAWSTEEQQQRIALCDLAVQDDDVGLAHARSNIVIEGRYRTRFRTAFLVRSPVPAERIVYVRTVKNDFDPPDVEISLNDVR
jgi:hypothetical protein